MHLLLKCQLACGQHSLQGQGQGFEGGLGGPCFCSLLFCVLLWAIPKSHEFSIPFAFPLTFEVKTGLFIFLGTFFYFSYFET